MEPDTPMIDEELCIGCGECEEACPAGAIAVVDGTARLIRPDDCNYCTECEAMCPEGAIYCGFEVVFEG